MPNTRSCGIERVGSPHAYALIRLFTGDTVRSDRQGLPSRRCIGDVVPLRLHPVRRLHVLGLASVGIICHTPEAPRFAIAECDALPPRRYRWGPEPRRR